MARTASLFSQLLDLIPRNQFQHEVKAHQAERYSKGFTCWEQFVAMLFCQLAQANSLREICDGLSYCLGKLIHVGVREAPNRSTVSYLPVRARTQTGNCVHASIGHCPISSPC